MKKIAMFLGAGASKAFKYPLTKDILQLIIKRIQRKTLFNDIERSKDRADLYRLMLEKLFTSLSPGIEKVIKGEKYDDEDSFPLITDLLSQAEHLTNNQQTLLDWNNELQHSLLEARGINERWDLKDVITLLDWAIIDVINKTGNAESEKMDGFIKWVKQTNASKKAFVTIITSNYDFSVEWNLSNKAEVENAHRLIDYGFNWRDIEEDGEIHLRPRSPKFRILKLHGSIDWLKCPRCGFIYINPLMDIYELAFFNRKTEDNTCHCNFWPLSPVLVTPSFSRTVKDANLSQIWTSTLEELRIADQWIITGYSLPPEDLDIKSMFLRALAGREQWPKITVIQQSLRSKPRFDYFFGKDRYDFVSGGFENYDFNQPKKGN